MQIWHTEHKVICQVADRGQITDPLAWHRARSELTLGGQGLWLVNQLCDLVQARTSQAGTVARLHMRLGQPARPLQTSPGSRRRRVIEVTERRRSARRLHPVIGCDVGRIAR